jgi:hypothetical protein
MLGILPEEIQETIFEYLPFKIGRSVNKHYQKIADKIETRNVSPIMVTKSIVDKYINESPTVILFSIIHSTRETITQRSIKVKEDLYVNDFVRLEHVNVKNAII